MSPRPAAAGRGRRSLAVLCLAWGALGSAAAADFRIIEYQGRRALLIQDEQATKDSPRGKIQAGDAGRFDKALREAMPVSEVLLNSGGGSEADGLAIGRTIRRAGLSTRVPKGALCASACADIFMGGVARRVDEGGRYGIHMATRAGNPKFMEEVFVLVLKAYDTKTERLDHGKVRELVQFFEQSAARSAAAWGAFVLEMGGSPRIVELGTQSGAGEMNWLSRQQMIDLNVINVDN